MTAQLDSDMPTFIPYLKVRIGHDMYGVALQAIQEILSLERLQVMPLVPNLVRGVMNVRGHIIPIIDAAVRLGQAEISVSARTHILIVDLSQQMPGLVLGLMVDAVEKIISIDPATIEQALPFGARIRKDFIEGLAHLHNQLIVLLSVDHLLSPSELEDVIGQ